MEEKVDILENDLLEKYPGVLRILLLDQSSGQNIIWATENYKPLGKNYLFNSQIFPELITGKNGEVIMPRVKKIKSLQLSRVRDMAEVFTPSWICNAQNNMIDKAWFEKENVFNKEFESTDGSFTWEVNPNKIDFPEGKTWIDYIKDKRIEIACGEAPYITSRYDTTTGEFISIKNRIGILDRKLRVINENLNNSREWLKAVQIAYKCTYGYEWQGDNLLLAREAMLMSFIENYKFKFRKEPMLRSIKVIANIISWNIWQMDGLKGVVPNSCKTEKSSSINLLGENEIKVIECEGCKRNVINKHNGTYCIIKDWFKKDKETNKYGFKIRYIDLLNNQD